MKTITHGKYHEAQYNVKCKFCDCVFNCNYDELRKEYDYGYDDLIYVAYIKCPECGITNEVFRDRKEVI